MNTVCKEKFMIGDLVWGDDMKVKFVINAAGKFKVSKTDFHIEENLSVINKQEWEDIKDEWVKSKEFDFDYEFVFEWLQKNYFCPEKKNT